MNEKLTAAAKEFADAAIALNVACHDQMQAEHRADKARAERERTSKALHDYVGRSCQRKVVRVDSDKVVIVEYRDKGITVTLEDVQ